jgi:hypothetical protein
LLWGDRDISSKEGNQMVDVVDNEEESLLASPSTPEMAVHVRDYEKFTRMMKYGAVTALVIGLIVLMILK